MRDLKSDNIKKYFSEELVDRVTLDEGVDLLLLVLNEKPGALVMGADRPTVKLLRKFAGDFGLDVKVVKGEERSLLDKLTRRDSRFVKDGVFLANSEDRFEILENSSGRFMGYSEKAVGKFLGYPDESVEYYNAKSTEELAVSSLEGELEKFERKQGFEDSERRHLKLVSYRPKPDRENILKAVEKGRQREEKLREMDSKLNISVGEQYLNEIYRRH